jgi:hypothetical protein
MKTHVLAVTLCAFIIVSGHSVAQTGGDISIGPTNPAVPIKPGDVRVGTRAPPGDWDVQIAPNRSQRVYKCKPLACPDAETVSFTFSKSPTAKPNPKALEKYAAVDLPKTMRALAAARTVMQDVPQQIETLSSKAATVKGYPAVVNETKFTYGKTVNYYPDNDHFCWPRYDSHAYGRRTVSSPRRRRTHSWSSCRLRKDLQCSRARPRRPLRGHRLPPPKVSR